MTDTTTEHEAELHNNLHMAAQQHLEAEIAHAMTPSYDTLVMVHTTTQARANAMLSLATYYKFTPHRRPTA